MISGERSVAPTIRVIDLHASITDHKCFELFENSTQRKMEANPQGALDL